MDAARVGRGEMIAGISGVILFIVMFFSWFGVPSEVNGISTQLGVELANQAGFDTSFNAWQSFDLIDLLMLITIIAAVGVAVAAATARTVALPVAASAIVTGLGGLSTLLVLYRIISPPSDASRKFGVFLGLVLCALITLGGWMAMQEEGASFSASSGGSSGGGAPPPPTPPAGGPPSAPPPAPPPAQ